MRNRKKTEYKSKSGVLYAVGSLCERMGVNSMSPDNILNGFG